jgi:hypothetical protein
MSLFTTVRQYFRRYADTPWYVESDTYRQHVDQYYHHSGKIVSSTFSLDDDQLILTKIVIWSNEEARTEFVNDPIVIAEHPLRSEHHELHGITFRMVVPNPVDV